MIKFLIFALFFALFGENISGEKGEDEEKFIKEHLKELSLEELLEEKVQVASKVKQTIAEAPAIVSVITKKELQDMGFENLYQVLSTIPGVEVMETYYGYTDLLFRGVYPYHYNNKVLLLLDGHPLEEPVNGAFYLKAIPVSVIERIEIIRGPGSTLYGTNAFSGVINIITVSKVKKGSLKGFVRYGSFNNKMGGLYVQGKLKKDFSYIFGCDFKVGENYKLNIDADMEGNSGSLSYRDNYLNSFFKIQYKGLQFHLFGALLEKDKYGIIPTIISTGVSHYTNFGANIAYHANAAKKLKFHFQAWFDYLRKEELMGKMPPIKYYPGTLGQNEIYGERKYVIYVGVKQGYDGYALYEPFKSFNIVGGLTYEYFIIKLVNSDEDIDVMNWSSLENPYLTLGFLEPYFEVNFSPFKFLKLTGGIRANYSSVSGWSYVPRAGAVFKLSRNLFLKLLYGEAYRVPSAFELWVEAPDVIDGNENLKPEKIKTFESGIDYKFKKLTLRLNGFYLYATSLIRRTGIVPAGERRNTRDTKQYENSGKISVYGVEFETKARLFTTGKVGLDVNFNLSYKKGYDEYYKRDIDFLSPFIFNAGFDLKLFNTFVLYPQLQFVYKRKGSYLEDVASNTFSTEKNEIPSYFLLNLKATYHVSKNISVSFIGINLLNQKIEYPDFVSFYAKNYINGYFDGSKKSIITVPGQVRTIYGELSVKF